MCISNIYIHTHTYEQYYSKKKNDGSFYVNINLGIEDHRVGVWEY